MKKAIVIVVFLFFLKPVFPCLEYIINYDYIVKELCVNKAKPEMKCNGKCHLMKELAKASEKEAPISSDKKSTHHDFEVLFFENKFFSIKSNCEFIADSELNSAYNNLYSFKKSNLIFHPPIV